MCRVFPPPQDPERIEAAVRAAVLVGETRTLQQDLAYGVRQLVDVALKAMSPGVNDPTTAHDAISHFGTVLADLLRRQPPAQQLTGPEGQVLHVPHATTHEGLVALAFDEIRLVSSEDPTVMIYLLEVLHQVEQALDGLSRATAVEALRRQAGLIRTMNEDAEVPEADRQRVRDTHTVLFSE